MIRKCILCFSAIAFLLIAIPASSKDGKMKLSSFCEYVGNVENKTAYGAGTLTISNPLIKGAADVITGEFAPVDDGYIITNASITFYSGWTYSGDVQILVNTEDSHNSSVQISLIDGEMCSHELTESFKIEKDPVLFSRIYDKGQKLYSLNGLTLHGNKAFYHKKAYSKYTRCDSIVCNFNLPIQESNGIWKYKFEPIITNHLTYTNGCCCDTEGDKWTCTTPNGDTVSFANGHYQAIRRNNDSYLHYIEKAESIYQSPIVGKFKGVLEPTVSLESFMAHSFDDADLKFISGVQEYPDSSQVTYQDAEIVGFNKKYADGNITYEGDGLANINTKEGVTGFNGLVSLNESTVSVITKQSLAEIQYSPIEGSLIYSNGDILYYKNREISGYYKRFKEALMDIRDGKGIVNYFDGGNYNGTMKVWTYISDKNIAEISSISDISLEFIDGIETHPNGTSDTWINGLTEYLKNKEAGNYEKYQSAMDGLNRDKVAALAKQWDKVRPSLEEEWGSRNVNAFYEGRFILGMPRGFIERIKELRLPLMNIVGPMEIDGGVYNDYIVVLADRVDGQSKTSYVLRFGGLFDELLSINK